MTKNESLWRTLWDYDPNGLVAVDLSLDIVMVNPAFCTYFNLNQNTVIEKYVREIFSNALENSRNQQGN